MTNIYLDIDGVLLANDQNPAKHADKFIKYVVEKFPNSTYWLTTHCRQKENYTVQLLSRFFSEDTMVYIRKIIPTEWDVLKTEAIDFSKPFLWFEDGIFPEERKALTKYNVLDNYIEVDLAKDENQLVTFLASFPIPVQDLNNNNDR